MTSTPMARHRPTPTGVIGTYVDRCTCGLVLTCGPKGRWRHQYPPDSLFERGLRERHEAFVRRRFVDETERWMDRMDR